MVEEPGRNHVVVRQPCILGLLEPVAALAERAEGALVEIVVLRLAVTEGQLVGGIESMVDLEGENVGIHDVLLVRQDVVREPVRIVQGRNQRQHVLRHRINPISRNHIARKLLPHYGSIGQHLRGRRVIDGDLFPAGVH